MKSKFPFILLVVFCLGSMSFLGCNKLKGDKGDSGPAGTQGALAPAPAPQPGIDFISRSGSIPSNDFTVSVPEIADGFNVSVYISDGSAFSEIPYFLPVFGVNVFFLANNSAVRIFNGLLAGGVSYIITVAVPAGAGSSGLERLRGF